MVVTQKKIKNTTDIANNNNDFVYICAVRNQKYHINNKKEK